MMKDLISIVMPVKNAALYLQECIDSIITQSERNWELIAVDDHSSDSSLELMNTYAKQDHRITVLRNRGNGIIEALQTAYAATKGEYLHRMDADDIMPAKKLMRLKKLLQSKGKGWVATGKVKYFAENSVSEGYLKYEEWLNDLCQSEQHWQAIYKECVIASPCWLVHRNDFEKCGGFDSDRYPEDYDLVFRFYEQGFQVVASEEVLHLWRDHSQRTSRNHIHYQQNAFFEIKLHYFMKLERDESRPLIIWGAGKKGKIMAKLLNQQNIEFSWVSNNPNKHGKKIYQQIMQSFESILAESRPQIIITVAQRKAEDEINAYLQGKGLSNYKDYWFFR